MQDEEIVGMYWLRNEKAIQETDRKYGRYLFKIAYNVLSDLEDSEESVNDTYLAAWNSIPPTRPRSIFAYLGKICRHAAFDLVDKRNAEKRSARLLELSQELQQCIPDRMAEAQLESRWIGTAINRFLGTLSVRERQIFVRRYWYGDSVNDIAAAFGIRQGAVKTRLFRTREKLKTYLEQEGIEL